MRSPLATALEQADKRRLDPACRRLGISFKELGRYASGERQPAPWLARELAALLGADPAELFPHD